MTAPVALIRHGFPTCIKGRTDRNDPNDIDIQCRIPHEVFNIVERKVTLLRLVGKDGEVL